jgi:hypothetical protein
MCGKIYSHRSSLFNHKKKCILLHPSVVTEHTDTLYKRDVIIDKLVNENKEMKNENKEMKSMITLLLEKMNNVIDVIPKIGNVTNNNTMHNTTHNLNFYLTDTCKHAESIHDFTERYVKKCSDFFIKNYRNIANNQVCMATNVYEIMFKCMEENPKYMNFIQTTDVKNGVHYVKEKKKDENRKLHGEAEFIKYVDGFEKAGASIGHAINKAILPLYTEFINKLEQEIGKSPIEDNFSNDEEYENELNKYKIRKQQSTQSLRSNVHNTMNLFDSKTRKMDILKNTKRVSDTVSVQTSNI